MSKILSIQKQTIKIDNEDMGVYRFLFLTCLVGVRESGTNPPKESKTHVGCACTRILQARSPDFGRTSRHVYAHERYYTFFTISLVVPLTRGFLLFVFVLLYKSCNIKQTKWLGRFGMQNSKSILFFFGYLIERLLQVSSTNFPSIASVLYFLPLFFRLA